MTVKTKIEPAKTFKVLLLALDIFGIVTVSQVRRFSIQVCGFFTERMKRKNHKIEKFSNVHKIRKASTKLKTIQT